MRCRLPALVPVLLLLPFGAFAANETIRIELNTAEPVESRCRMNFVVENKADVALDSLKLDLVVFATDGAIARRVIAEMGPLRPLKTVVKSYLIDNACNAVAALLVNEVTACAPGTPVACLDGLSLSSRVKEIRLYK